MIKIFRNSTGQALVIIALAMMGLIGMVGLAIDGGNTYADRRQAQNAADSSAMAAALANANDPTLSINAIETLVINSTTTNGYSNTAPRSTITVTKTTAPTECGSYTIGSFFQVDITSIIPTYFANAIGVPTLTNTVSARSLSCPPHQAPAGLGNALTALNPTICPGAKVGGSSHIIVNSSTNQGLFVNSSCNEGINSANVAMSAGGNGTVTTPSVMVVGGVYGQDIFAPTIVQTGAEPINLGAYWPTFACTGQVTISGTEIIGGITYNTFTPGVYPGTNTSWANKDFPPETNSKLEPGIYCLDRDFNIQANNRLIGSGVTFVSRQGNVIFRGGNGVNLQAPTSDPYKGLLLFVTEANTTGTVMINGNANLVIVGSIIAPWNLVDIKGTGDVAAPLQTQIVADTLNFSGNGTITITYNGDDQYKVPMPGSLELFK